MAELVDALVSNTSGFTSMPVRSRLWVQKMAVNRLIISRFFFFCQANFRNAWYTLLGSCRGVEAEDDAESACLIARA